MAGAVRAVRRLFAIVSLALLACACGAPGDPEQARVGGPDPAGPRVFRARQMLMGTYFDIQVVSDRERDAQGSIEAAFAELARIEELLSEWRETSEISEVNRRAGQGAVVVGPELYTVVDRALRIGELTGGAFDLTFASCGGLWSVREERIPDDAAIAICLPNVDYRRVLLDPGRSTIHLPGEGMRIGIAGIGKGYGIDRAAEVLEAHGIADYVVDGGGDIRLRGSKPEGAWTVGIQNPRQLQELYASLSPGGGAIVTSGDYQQYFERDGVRYHHILDPATGHPARRTVAVTVIASNAMDADALATGLFVLGPERGLALVERMERVDALFFDPALSVVRSSGFPELNRLP